MEKTNTITNKKIRSRLAAIYRNKLRIVNEKCSNLRGSKEERQSTRERLIANLQSKLSKEKRYEKARATHRAELKAKGFVNSAKQEKKRLQEEYEKKMAEVYRDIAEKTKAYEDAQVAHRGKVEDKVKVEEGGLEDLRGNKDAILDALKENYIKIEENTEVMGHKGKKVHINLPKVGWFEGFKFDYFVSDDYVNRKDFKAKPELEKKSYSINDVLKLLKAMNGFMAALGCETDLNMEYGKLKCWRRSNKWNCIAGDCLKTITGLNSWYWLRDKNVAGVEGSRAEWRCDPNYCIFDRDRRDSYYANLFLRLS